MEKVIKADESVLKILGKAKKTNNGYRMLSYCVALEIPEGQLLFNEMTRELLLLTKEEFDNRYELDYLKDQWFIVPENLNEKEYVELVRWVCQSVKGKPKTTTGYTILTTTDCNARCYYCYEKGYKKVQMSEETAKKVAAFIKEQSNGEKVGISWFGGEPLYNDKVIDIICKRLQEESVDYQCSMVSNGYLFDADIIERAKKLWNLKRVQITLDGTEHIYNRSKAFIYPEGSAYQIVLSNIAKLLQAGISVVVRMNLGLHNAEDLLLLVDELAERFKEQKGLRAYAHLIFEDDKSWEEVYSQEKLIKLYDTLEKLEKKLNEYDFAADREKGLSRKVKFSRCMADGGESLVITPDGHLGLCEHFAESELIGHIDSNERDEAMITSWKERKEELPECRTCFYYPECMPLKKCTGDGGCSDLQRNYLKQKVERAMRNEFSRWQTNQTGVNDAAVL